MQMPRLLPVLFTLGIAAALAPAATASPSPITGRRPVTAPAPTKSIVVRPVTSSGHAAAGFTVMSEPTGSVDCSFAEPSPGAVSPNIEFCSPSAEYAIACWKAAKRHHVYCMRDPRKKQVALIPRAGAYADTAIAKRRDRAPLLIVLGDNDVCTMRSGGTGGTLPDHPKLYATYYCVRDGAVWAPASPAHLGINESTKVWTVRTAVAGSSNSLRTRRVKTAYFVGTKRLTSSTPL